MAAKIPTFTEEEMAIDQNLGYPKAYSKHCNNSRSFTNPYINGPPLCFIPYTLQPQEALRAKDLNEMFPVADLEAVPSTNPRGYVNLLWKQLDHLGNAGFDPALFRVDPHGNVLYLHADSASPLAWDIDHWFPCSRGGKTVPGNLRLLQWQVCQKKKNKLEFLVPWWDLQLGMSVNQFLSIFASKNSDFRNRAFSFLFLDGSSEEINALQSVESHSFPQHFIDMKQEVGLAPAAIVSMQRDSDSSVLKPVDINKSVRHNSPFPGVKKFSSLEHNDAFNMAIQRFKPNISKENENPDDFSTDPYLSITRARDSLRQRGENKKKEAEISQLNDELNDLRQKNESERIALQDLEALLIKRRRRVEKCRRLAEAQSSYRSMLEKMIRDAMHQSVVYKEQIRLNHAATSALMARLEAQRAICDNSENELRRKYSKRDEIEKQIMRPCWEEQARKRSRMDYTLFEERNEDCIKGWTPLKKELRDLLAEEQKASEAGLSLSEEEENGVSEDIIYDVEKGKKCKAFVLADSKITDNGELKKLKFKEGSNSKRVEMQKASEAGLSLSEEEENEVSEDIIHDVEKGKKCKALALADSKITDNGELKKLKFKEGSNSKRVEPKKNISYHHRQKLDYEEDHEILNHKLGKLAIGEGNCSKTNEIVEGLNTFGENCGKCNESKKQQPTFNQRYSNDEEEEEHRNQVGKGNVDKWLKVMLENAKGDSSSSSSIDSPAKDSDRDQTYPEKEIKFLKLKPLEDNSSMNKQQRKDRRNLSENGRNNSAVGSTGSRKSFEAKEEREKNKGRNLSGNGRNNSAVGSTGSRKSFKAREEREKNKGGSYERFESSKGFRTVPSSPSVILSMKSADCMGKKTKVMGDDENEANLESVASNSSKFIKTCTRTIKKAVKI